MTVKLLAENHLEFLSMKGGCTGWPESTLVKMPHCWKSRVAAQYHEEESLTLCIDQRFLGLLSQEGPLYTLRGHMS